MSYLQIQQYIGIGLVYPHHIHVYKIINKAASQKLPAMLSEILGDIQFMTVI